MTELPVTGAIAEYRGQQFRILFSTHEWVALHAAPHVEIPDAFARGESPAGQGHYNPWAKVPRTALDGLIDVDVSAFLPADTVIAAVARRPNQELFHELEWMIDELHVCGDAVLPRGFGPSIHDGYRLGCRV